jgi:putative component of membrane protein insertase Oxa1/YidC/SpoIIIJ protein YidD
MALRLNFIVNYPIILLIKFYQRFISNRINRKCIYTISCSSYALNTLNKSRNIFKSIYKIYRRYTGCKILDIVCKNSCKWHVINANGNIIKTNQLHFNTIEDINKTIDSYKVSNNL